MSRLLEVVQGMKVITPLGEVARIEGPAADPRDAAAGFYRLTYLNTEKGEVTMAAKRLRVYDGPPLLFPDACKKLADRYRLRPKGGR